MLTAATIQDVVCAYLKEHAERLHLNAADLGVSYLINEGGFCNVSFTITDSNNKRYHLKLARDSEAILGLKQWYALSSVLHERYSAPRAVEYVVVVESICEGILFEHIEGVIPEIVSDEVKGKILKTLYKLHIDRDLAACLPSTSMSCRDAYLNLYHDRFMGDLDCIREVYKACITQDRFVWMEKEVAQLESAVKNNPAFNLPATSPTHRDPWLNNFLVTREGVLYVLDWDGLQLSDPMLDLAMAFGPSIKNIQAQNINVLPPGIYPLDNSMRSRLEIYRQAALLDWIIDPLADYFECAEAGDRVSAVRAQKMRIHMSALSEYMKYYS